MGVVCTYKWARRKSVYAVITEIQCLKEVIRSKIKMYRDEVTDHILQTWMTEQDTLKKKLILSDTEEWQKNRIIATITDAAADSKTKGKLKKAKNKKPKQQNESLHDVLANAVVASNLKTSSALEEEMKKLHVSDSDNGGSLLIEGRKLTAPVVDNRTLKYVAGVDVSYVKSNKEKACAAFVIVCLPDFQVVYEDIRIINISVPYIPGYLAFREISFLVDMVETLRRKSSPYFPQAILVDGNGILHPRGFGAASHLGVLLNMPTVGAAKNLHKVDGLPAINVIKNSEALQRVGDILPLKDTTGKMLGAALKTSESAKNPIYVSPGHQCSLETAIWLVQVCCRYRIPEPIRQADIRSREHLRTNAV